MKKKINARQIACSGSVGTVVSTKARRARVFDKLRKAGFLYRVEEAVCGVAVHYVRAPNAAVAVQRVLDGDSVGEMPKAEDLERCLEHWACFDGMDVSEADRDRLSEISDTSFGDGIEGILSVSQIRGGRR